MSDDEYILLDVRKVTITEKKFSKRDLFHKINET